MPDFRIRKYPDNILQKKAKKLDKVTPGEREELVKMSRVMYLNKGVGLAATQVGIDKYMAVIDVGDGLIQMINPSITRKEGADICEEGCLSIPDTSVKIKRAKRVVTSFMNEKGEVVQIRADGLLAKAIQHEVDHLEGRLIIDYMNPVKKALVKRRLAKESGKRQ